MQIEIEYPILTRGIPERAQRERLLLLNDRQTFEIEEYGPRDLDKAIVFDGPEAPLLVRDGKLYSRIKDHARVEMEDAFRHRFAFDAGKRLRYSELNTPWSALTPAYDAELKRIRNSQLPVVREIGPESVSDVIMGKTTGEYPPLFDDFRFRSYDEEAVHRQRAEMVEGVSHLCFVDGELWRECHPPVAIVTPIVDGYTERPSISVSMQTVPHFAPFGSRVETAGRITEFVVCGLSELGDVVGGLGHALAAAGHAVDRRDVAWGMSKFKIRDDEAFTTDTPGLGILEAARTATVSFLLNADRKDLQNRGRYETMTSALAEASIDEIAAFKTMADGIKRAATAGVDEATASAVAETIGSEAFYHLNSFDRQPHEMRVAIRTEAVRAWDERPVASLAGASMRL